jgi:CheY-like chemotaxis protein
MTLQPVDKSAIGGLEEAAGRAVALLSTVGRILDAVTDEFDAAIDAVVSACVPAFADLCAIEVIGADGEMRTASSGATGDSGMRLPEQWVDVVKEVAGVDQPVLAGDDAAETPLGAVRERLGARSMLVAPIVVGGAKVGWLAAATGADRRTFVGMDLEVGGELCGRLGATMHRVGLSRQLRAAALEQSRVAHDLNNLLTLILGYSDLLGRGIGDPQLRALAGEIEGAARRAAALTQEMLNVSVTAVAPRSPATAVSEPHVRAADGDGWPPERTMAGRILYVEDEPALRRAGQESLATAGLDVVAAESAERALSILAGDPSVDVLVTDIALPGLTGVQLVRAVRRTHPDLRVLYVTGYSGVPDPEHTPAPGEPVLRKPYRPDTLRLRVAELLERPERRGSEPVHGS